MKNLLQFYSEQKNELEKEVAILKKKLFNLGVFRFALFLGTCFLIYVTFGEYPTVFVIAFLGVLFFSFLVVKFINLKKKKILLRRSYKLIK